MTEHKGSHSDEHGWRVRGLEFLALTGFVYLFYTVPDGATPWVLSINLVAFYLLFIRSALTADNIAPEVPSYLSIEFLFLTFSYLIFYYPYQLFLIGKSDLRASEFVSNTFTEGSNRAITLATIGMYAFSFGYRLIRKASADAQPFGLNTSAQLHSQQSYFHSLVTVTTLLLMVFAGTYLYSGIRSAGEGRYTATTTQGLGVEGLSTIIMMLCMVIAALWIYSRASGIPTTVTLAVGVTVAIAWTVRLLLLGDRSAVLLFSLALFGGYFTFVRKSSRVLIAAVFSVGMIIYNAIEVIRFTPNWYTSENLLSVLFRAPEHAGPAGETSFNVTTMTLRATVATVPQFHDFAYGTFKLLQFSSVIPFGAKLYLPYLHLEYMQSSEMLGNILLGPHATWDPGTNVISDAYLDFGVPGVVIILFAVGVFAKMARNSAARKSDDPKRVVLYVLAMALFAELPRYAVELPARMLAWTFVLLVVVGVFSRHRNPSSGGNSPISQNHMTHADSVAGHHFKVARPTPAEITTAETGSPRQP